MHIDVDIVAEHGKMVVFVEVKTRRSDKFGTPAEAVSKTKRERLRRTVAAIRSRDPDLDDRPCRIDVIEVEWPRDGGEPRIRHLEDAVDRGDWD